MYNFTSFVIISMPLKKLVYVHSKRMILKKISSKVVVFYFRLPSNLIVTWPEGDEVRPNEKRPAGKTIGLFSFLFNNAQVPSKRKKWFPFYSKIWFRKIHELKSCLNLSIYDHILILPHPLPDFELSN